MRCDFLHYRPLIGPAPCLQRSLWGFSRHPHQRKRPCTASPKRTGGTWSKRGCKKKKTTRPSTLTLPVYCPAACACPADPVHEPDLADRSTAQRSSCVCLSRLLAARVAAEHPFADRLFPPLPPRASLTCRSSAQITNVCIHVDCGAVTAEPVPEEEKPVGARCSHCARARRRRHRHLGRQRRHVRAARGTGHARVLV